MKKFVSSVLLFFLLPVLLGLAWTAFVVVMDYRSYTGALKMPETATVAVCGDSQTKDALDPAIVPGLFNFSTAATTCDQDLLRLLDLLVANRGRVKYVLLDVSPLKVGYSTERPVSELNAARVHTLLHVYHLPVNRRAFGSVGALWRDVVCTRKYNEFRKSILRGKPWRSSMAGAFDPDKAQGFLNPKYRALALQDVAEKAARVNRRPAATINLPLFGVLAESVGLVRAAGATPIITTMPLSPALCAAFDAEKRAALREAPRDVAVRLGVDELDYLDLRLDAPNWHDGNHLNRTGAAAFSARFAADLAVLRRKGHASMAQLSRVERLSETVRPAEPADLSGLSWAGGDTYWSVRDSGGILCELRLPVDPATGRVTAFEVRRSLKVPGGKDLEGTAYDPLRKSVWVSDEKGPAIFEFRPEANDVGARVELPRELFGIRKNRGLEALAVSPDGLEMWTCNENELPADETASPPAGCEFLRLTRFVRRNADASWHVAGQWAYRPETPGGLKIRGRARNGVSSICILEDGTPLVMEREKRLGGKVRFRVRLFQIDLAGATDVRAWTSLGDADFVPVRKRLLYEADTGRAMYEGVSRGPRLADGRELLILVSDGDDEAREMLLTLAVSRVGRSD